MKIYLLRHGQTSYNVEKRYQGTRDIPLSEEGRAQLIQADIFPKKVYVSPLIRARSTADILFPEAEQVPVESGRQSSVTVPATHLPRWWKKRWQMGKKCW